MAVTVVVTWSEHDPAARRKWPRPAGLPPFARFVRPDPPPARLDGPRPAAYGACSVMLGGIFGVGPTPPDAGQCRPAQTLRVRCGPGTEWRGLARSGPRWPKVARTGGPTRRGAVAARIPPTPCFMPPGRARFRPYRPLRPVPGRAIDPRNGSGAIGTATGRRTPYVHQIFAPFLDARPVLWNMRRRTRPFFRKEHI